MFEKYIVKRSDYDKDIERLRGVISMLNRDLRDMEGQKSEAQVESKNKELEVAMLHHEIGNLRKKMSRQVEERSLKDYLMPVPVGETPRAQYMSQVSGFFEGGLRDKLNYMHTQFKNQTAMFPLNERETDFFRSCINVVGLLLDWGEECIAEHRANIASANNLGNGTAFDSPSDEQEESVKKIKKKLK